MNQQIDEAIRTLQTIRNMDDVFVDDEDELKHQRCAVALDYLEVVQGVIDAIVGRIDDQLDGTWFEADI